MGFGKAATPPVPQRIGTGVILRLASPAVFVDDNGRPTLTPNAADVSAQLGVPCRIVRNWTRWHDVGGWHTASGLPKSTELAAAAGSTYLVEPCDRSEKFSDDALLHLGSDGVGLRRHEGFGHLTGPPHLTLSTRRRREVDDQVNKLIANLAHVRAHPEVLEALRGYAADPPTAEREAVLAAAARWDDSLKLVSSQARRAMDTPMPLLQTALGRMGGGS